MINIKFEDLPYKGIQIKDFTGVEEGQIVEIPKYSEIIIGIDLEGQVDHLKEVAAERECDVYMVENVDRTKTLVVFGKSLKLKDIVKN